MEVLRSIRQLEPLRDEWNALAGLHGRALLRHEWFMSAARMLHGGGRLAVVIRRTGTRVDAIAPLAGKVIGGVERLEIIGAEALHEPTGFLARDTAARAGLVEDVLRLRRPLVLQRLSVAGQAADLEAAARGRGTLIVKTTAPSLSLPLAAAGAGSPAALPGKLRYDLKRARARAADRGEVTFEAAAPGAGAVDEALDAFIRVEASGWKARRGSALAVDARAEAFFRAYSRLSAEAGTLRVFFLRVGGAVAAAQIAVEVYERLWVLKIGYDEALSRCSPGLLLTAEAIQHARRAGLRSYEFLGAAEAWEERWRPEKQLCTLAVFYPWNLRGGMSASVDMAGAAWRRLRPDTRHAN